LFKPLPGGGLSRAEASIQTVYGLASIKWEIEDGQLKVETLVPHNATASLVPPVGGAAASAVELGSGRESFTYPWAATPSS
jgi:alpha-L-rhamnosidase